MGGLSGIMDNLCHALVLSGLPAREEVFSASLCSNRALPQLSDEHPSSRDQNSGGAAPPLIVESIDGSSSKDIVFAMGMGSVSRYDSHGNLQWTRSGPITDSGFGGVPTWGSPKQQKASPAYLDRIDFTAVSKIGAPSIRPVVVSGENGMSILSSGRGHVLASTTFPQSSISRPILADLSGDGTTDVVVVSRDGIWGYKVTVQTGGSKLLRIAVGLVLVGIGAAALWNKFAQPPGVDRRSTDA